ncbi:MAG: AsmA-like C-terminal domain-containing protein [Myxococcota bacterium]
MSRRRAWRWGLAALLLLASLVAGLYAASTLGPEQLRREVERQVAQATGARCNIDSLRVRPGLPIELEAGKMSLLNGDLQVERASARLSLGASLMGNVRLSRLELEGVTLRLRGDASGIHLPNADPQPHTGGEEDHAEHVAPEFALRELLRGPHLADHLRLRDGRIEVIWADETGATRTFSAEDLEAELDYRQLRAETALVARMRVVGEGAQRGALEWEATLDEPDDLDLQVTANGLDLGWAASWFGAATMGPAGRLDGVIDLRATPDRPARAQVDWVMRDFALVEDGVDTPLWGAPRIASQATIRFDEDRFEFEEVRLRSGAIDVDVSGSLSRPVDPKAALALRAKLADIAVEDLVAMTGNAAAFEDARDLLGALGEGRIVDMRAEGEETLARWEQVFTGESGHLPEGFRLEAGLEELRIALDEDDALERVAMRASLAGDRLEVRGLTGSRDGFDLPILDLDFDGVSHLLDSDLANRVPVRDEVLLAGLPLLISVFEPEPGEEAEPPHFEVRLDHLAHPLVLWPLRSVEVGIDGRGEDLVAEIRRATWAEVPLRGTLIWDDDPMRLTARLVARAPDRNQRTPAPIRGDVWARGTLEIGPWDTDLWSHEKVQARVRGVGASVYFDGVQAAIRPQGHLVGDGSVDLSTADVLPYRGAFVAQDLDAAALFAQAGLGEELVTGRVDVRADLEARHRDGVFPLASLSGRATVDAYDGTVKREMPALLALTLSTESLDLSGGRDQIRYTRCEVAFDLEEGVAKTDGLEFDGPDVRVFGTGQIDIGHEPHGVDAELVVFLFRPVDRALGSIPILGNLLLGGANNLVAAHFKLSGPWDAPTARPQPLRSLNAGPIRMVTGLPSVVRRGIEELGLASPGGESPPKGAEPEPEPPAPDPEAAPAAPEVTL